MLNRSPKTYKLHQSHTILKNVYSWYKKKGNTLSKEMKLRLEDDMEALSRSLDSKNRQEASDIATRLDAFSDLHCKRSVFTYAVELVFALIFALIIATFVRQMWFEPYEIPTGSMRPTFKEQDHLTVTKTAFGINFPLKTEHLYFDRALVQRTSVVIFSGDGLPLSDVDTTYFGIFPYKKRYIKRLIGKPGDSLYFYGGQVYGYDKEGNEIKELRESPWMKPLEHIPFLSFEGEIKGGNRGIFFQQMHTSVGRVTWDIVGSPIGEVFNGKEWVKDNPLAQAKDHNSIETYSDFLGMRGFAEARLLTKDELIALHGKKSDIKDLEDGILYLEMRHTPSLNYPSTLIQNGMGGIAIPGYTAIIPLKQSHLDAIMNHMYTSRFVVKNEKGILYRIGKEDARQDSPEFAGVEDGTYEFYYGKVKKIGWGGTESDVASDNPLYSHSKENIQKLFNLGIEMSTQFAPSLNNRTFFPHRYAYFRDGDLYLLGAKIVPKEDSILLSFQKREEAKEAAATTKAPYVAFKDYGPPKDKEFVKTFGITLKDKEYLVLGDNHAVSADSRVFGFVNEDNLQGAPCYILWPFGDRFGSPPQMPYPFMNLPRAIIWAIAAIIFTIWYVYEYQSKKKPILIKRIK